MVTIGDAAGVVIVTEWAHTVACYCVALGSILSALPRRGSDRPAYRISPRIAQLGGNLGGSAVGVSMIYAPLSASLIAFAALLSSFLNKCA